MKRRTRDSILVLEVLTSLSLIAAIAAIFFSRFGKLYKYA